MDEVEDEVVVEVVDVVGPELTFWRFLPLRDDS